LSACPVCGLDLNAKENLVMVSERAREMLTFIRRFTREKGYPPTIREIGEEFGISSTNGVRYHLSRLEKSGMLKRNLKISRGIAASSPDSSEGGGSYSIRILGQIAAGPPTLAEESFEGSIEPLELFGDPNSMFALRVRGDSMIDAGILEGDYVIVRRQERANAGEIIATLTQYTSIKDPALLRKITPAAVNPDGRVNLDGMRTDLAFYREQGLVQDPKITAEDVVDMSFVDAVVRELGPYKAAKP